MGRSTLSSSHSITFRRVGKGLGGGAPLRSAFCRSASAEAGKPLQSRTESRAFKPRTRQKRSSITMTRTTGRHLLCLLVLFFPLSWAEDAKKDVRRTENVTGMHV
ncbi:hypothetical protein ATANTOWER_015165 [Ataeniobius toweri]|uniref:Transmembrane protein n=1 Tax=Ataeniobius toweri TaxID=208326 RepID=A0ABU7A7W9_9TELE|nr:hypothetical protein [Ataeniobius toweri]